MYESPPNPVPLARLAYPRPQESGARVGQSPFGIASAVLALVTLVGTVVWCYGLFRVTGYSLLLWVIAGVVGNWVGCGFGFMAGVAGILQKTRGRLLAIHGMWVCGVLSLVPMIVLQITTSK